MGFIDIMSEIAGGASQTAGNISKATLVFPSINTESPTKEESTAAAGSSGLSTLTDSAGSALSKVSDVLNAAASIADTASSIAGSAASSNATTAISTYSYETLEVQFNPASLEIDAHGGGSESVSNYSKEGSKNNDSFNNGAAKVGVKISFTLIFDSTYIADAFAADKFSLSATSLVKNIPSLFSQIETGNEYTVRPFVEGFLAMIRDPDHRTLIFNWGKLGYSGVVDVVDCRYTMFNLNGEPIRAEVRLTVSSESQPDAAYKDSEGGKSAAGGTTSSQDYWVNRYTAVVQDQTSLSGKNIKSAVTNLLNL